MLNLITIVILGATLIDGSGRAPLRDSAVIIRGDSIVAVGRRGQVKIPRDARVIDARGLVVAPGFIDAHNHSDRGFATDPSAASQVSPTCRHATSNAATTAVQKRTDTDGRSL